ncbi:MAG: HD-GYP domain-containing protein [Clostridia bacterium]|nr:HD-GYP domain-containing protein [Clostridia bacterium]
MRKYMQEAEIFPYKIMAVDDDAGILDSLKVVLKRSGYDLTCFSNPVEAINELKNNHYDLLLLDFIMDPLHGDQVVEEIRTFDKSLYILLLTGHKDLAPPLETLKKLDIQGYCEKSNNFDQLFLLIESGLKSVDQMHIINDINEELKDKNEELEKAYLDTIGILRQTVEAKDPYTRGHSDRVSEYSVLLGTKLGLDEKSLHVLKIGGLFHDIGKIGIPDSILLKESKLDDEEYSQIKNHPSIGAHILGDAEIFKDILPIVLHHHERFDGRGYPSQLEGENIPYLARIAAVVDTFDAMTSKRSYRDAMPIGVVKAEIKKCSGTQFDPKCAEAFLDILENEYDKIENIKNKYQG